jgi:ubiquinone/menaquinone biosynthesis C-methylase UbiE
MSDSPDVTSANVGSDIVDAEPRRAYASEVRDYWEQTTELYLQYGTTFQGGYIVTPNDSVTPRSNNLNLAERAGIRPGDRVLDAGCGVCGPSVDIARNLADVHIDAVTVSPTQVRVARERVIDAGLADRIDVHECDYHALPFAAGRFDVVFFMEGLYTRDLARVFSEARRVLRPGGRLYAKEVFCREGALTDAEQEAVREFEDVYCYKVRRLSEAATTATAVGFVDVETHDLNALAHTEHYARAMTEPVFGFPVLTEFGRRHYRRSGTVPVLFGQLRARAPADG